MTHYLHFNRILAVLLASTFVTGVPAILKAENLLPDLKTGDADIVTVEGGDIQGYRSGEVSVFLGVPYAAPPVGDLRWMPPVKAASWDGVRDGGDFGESCVQTTTYGVFATPSKSEDCLYLNVFAPTAERNDKKRPVMVWLHGGSLINGRADDYDARKLAADGDVIVVTLNYRLNVFGYFAHPALDNEGHSFGNYGTMDQQAALRWVQENAAAFGGDPENVTLFGESAGGLAVLLNMVSPAAEGLFHKVILESGVSASPQTPLEKGEADGLKLSEALGCTDAEAAADCMRSASVDDIIGAGKFTGGSSRVIDGEILPGQMQDLIAAGEFHRVPILMGNNHNEWTWFISFGELASGQPMKAEDYVGSFVRRDGEDGAEKIAKEYPLENFPSASEAASVAGTSRNFVCPSYRVMASAAQHVPVYAYEFMDTDAPFYFPEVSYPYAAGHTLELQYLFPRYHGATGAIRRLDGEQQKLSDTMVKYWTNFASASDPNGEGMLTWKPWQNDAPNLLLLDKEAVTEAADAGVDRKCSFWDAL